MNPLFEPVSRLSRFLGERSVSSVELMEAFIARTRAVEGRLRAFNSFDAGDALGQARASDTRRAEGRALGPLDGIPVGIKDLIAVAGQPLTASSRMLANYVSPYDSTVASRLKGAGAILWGRLNLDEFAMGSSSENSAFSPVSNPWDLERVPGGSSGGSAAAVAAGEAPASLGSDTGGSIRQPAAFCGLVGLKPTYGRVSRHGLAAFASSLDQIGPLARTVEDAAIILGAIAGRDPMDSTSFDAPVPDYRDMLLKDRGPWKIGVAREYLGEGLDARVAAAVEAAIAHYRGLGCEIREVSLPHTRFAVAAYYIIATAECSSNLARYDGVRYGHRAAAPADAVDLYFQSRAEGFGPEVKRRIILGAFVLSSGHHDAYYIRAQKARTVIRGDFLDAFREVDVILTPTVPAPAFRKGEKSSDPLAMYLSDIFTIGASLAGLPAVSVPAGFTRDGLPLGFQLIGRPFDEPGILAVAGAYERDHAWHERHPPEIPLT